MHAPQTHPLLSIIIVSYNTAKITQNCINSILQSRIKVPYEIIIVDNNSTDNTVSKIRNSQFEIRNVHNKLNIIQNTTNVGFARANNQGVNIALGQYILLLNSDTIILDNAIQDLLDYYQSHPNIQFLGPKLLNADNSPQPSCAPFYTLPVIFAALFLRGDYWGLTRWSPHTSQQVDWLSGACILTKKEYYKSLNGFDEAIFMYMDEVDLLYRGHLLNYYTYCYPKARVVHLGSASSSGRTEPILQVYKGFLYFYKKHYSRFTLIILKFMLQLKAVISLIIGFITNNSYLKKTYGKAFQMAR